MNWGRAVLPGLLGLIGGAAAGLLLAMLLVYLWFAVLHLPPLSNDPKPGIAMLGWVVPIWMVTGGISGATDMVRRVRAGRRLGAWAWVFGLSIVAVMVSLGVIIS